MGQKFSSTQSLIVVRSSLTALRFWIWKEIEFLRGKYAYFLVLTQKTNQRGWRTEQNVSGGCPQLLIYSVKVPYHKYNHIMSISRDYSQHSFEIPGCQHFPNPFKCKLNQKMSNLPGILDSRPRSLKESVTYFESICSGY